MVTPPVNRRFSFRKGTLVRFDTWIKGVRAVPEISVGIVYGVTPMYDGERAMYSVYWGDHGGVHNGYGLWSETELLLLAW